MHARHVGIIMDGNRRFSKRLMKKPWEGHALGREKLQEVLKWCKEYDVQELTVFALSTQNFSRPKTEFQYLMQLFQSGLEELLEKKEDFLKQDIHVRFIGRRHLLPEPLPELMNELEELTKDCSTYRLNIAIAYGGKEEIVDAVQALASDIQQGSVTAEDVSENVLGEYMQLQHQPDLIIRTGGDNRTSNFLVWQSTYSEWMFVDTLWPEFSKEEFKACLDDFANRERRFGK